MIKRKVLKRIKRLREFLEIEMIRGTKYVILFYIKLESYYREYFIFLKPLKVLNDEKIGYYNAISSYKFDIHNGNKRYIKQYSYNCENKTFKSVIVKDIYQEAKLKEKLTHTYAIFNN